MTNFYSSARLLLCSFALLSAIHSGFAQDARSVFQRVSPSVVALVMEDGNRQPLSLGSGFVVRDELVVTNFHVIQGSAGGRAKLVGAPSFSPIQGVVAMDAALDLAILRIPGLRATPLMLAVASSIAVGDTIFAVGTPQGLEGTLSQGIVSGIRTIGDSSLFQITAPISPGSSGGPVLDTRGNVIGVAVSTLRGGQNLNFAVSSAHVQQLLRNTGQSVPLSTASKIQRPNKNAVLPQIGGTAMEKVSTSNISCTRRSWGTWSCNFSVHNGLEVPIREVRYLVILRDKAGRPIDSMEGRVAEHQSIRPGLAIRSYPHGFDIEDETKRLVAKIEVRLLDFKSIE